MFKKIIVLSCGFFLFFLMPGCALQSNMVEIEYDVEALRKHRWELQGRLEHLEKKMREVSSGGLTDKKKQSAEMVVQVDDLKTDFQVLSGLVSEDRHHFSGISKRMEDQSFRAQDLLNRLEDLESRLFAVEASGFPKKGQEFHEERTVLPGKKIKILGLGNVLSPTEAYNLAYNDYLKGNYDLAIISFKNFSDQYQKSALIPQSIYWTGESYYGKKFFSKAIEYFDRLRKEHPRSEKVSSALLKIGFAHLELGDRVKARIHLKRVIEQFPNSNEALLAKDQLAALN
ncbi:MAG: tol-pal system protein YbgF [Nitrospira sp.]|nr:tol-pal system protein YbgF [Candidatus Manganitrophaceae bacterium]HIL34927.1 tol-pal system protein YbgF [Candidatus Manganitrophaceae bacterium]